MLKQFSVSGYKSIENATLSDLSSINIIVGKSASGKTALLEAIRVGLSGNPSTMWNTSSQRGGFNYFPPAANAEQFEGVWRPFFHNFDVAHAMRFEMIDDMLRNASLTIYVDRSTSMPITTMSQPSTAPVISSINPLAFMRTSYDGEVTRLIAAQQQGGALFFEPGSELIGQSEFLSSSTPINFNQVANWFSALSIEDKEHDIVKIVCSAFPNISGVSVQSPQGVTQLYATLRSLNRKLPLTSVSSGINKFISILIAMRTYAGGCILIDEIENGIYYDMLPLMWKTINSFAKITDTQIFASTHSWECLKSAASVFENDPKRLRLLQVHQENGNTIVSTSSGSDATNAIIGDIEVRR